MDATSELMRLSERLMLDGVGSHAKLTRSVGERTEVNSPQDVGHHGSSEVARRLTLLQESFEAQLVDEGEEAKVWWISIQRVRRRTHGVPPQSICPRGLPCLPRSSKSRCESASGEGRDVLWTRTAAKASDWNVPASFATLGCGRLPLPTRTGCRWQDIESRYRNSDLLHT